MWKTYRKSEGHYIAPSKVNFAFRMAHPMFRGFHQQDAQVKTNNFVIENTKT